MLAQDEICVGSHLVEVDSFSFQRFEAEIYTFLLIYFAVLQDKFSVALRFYITLMYKIMWPPAGKNTLLQETENNRKTILQMLTL